MAGAFVVSREDEVEHAFAESEPPAHDDWIPDNFSRGRAKSYVTIALKRLKGVASEMGLMATGQPETSNAGPPLARVAGRLGAALEGVSGDGAGRKRGTGRGRRARPARAKATPPLFERLELAEAGTVAVFSTEVSQDAHRSGSSLAARAAVAIEGSSASRIDEDIRQPVVLSIRSPDRGLSASSEVWIWVARKECSRYEFLFPTTAQSLSRLMCYLGSDHEPAHRVPFLTLSDAAVEATPWSFSLNGGDWNSAGDFLADWDAASAMRFRRTVKLDPLVAADDLGVIVDNLRLSLGVRIGTGPGRLPRLILSRNCRELTAGTWQEEFDIEITGQRLSLVLDLHTQVVLAAPPKDCAQLSPRRVADRLWSDTLRIRLEGEEPRFPIEITDMRTLLGSTAAASTPWYLHWSPLDWNRDFHGAARLYLNKDHTDFIERIEQHDGPTLQVLLADVMGQICERLLIDPEAEEIMAGADPGSMGAQATAWLQKPWPGKDAAFIRSVLESQPGTFRAAFLALAELGEA